MLTFLALTIGLAFADSKCPAGRPMDQTQMTPEGVRSWLAGNTGKISRVEDLVCCLPESFKGNFFISHASIAGQNASPESPRLLLTDGIVQSSTDRDVMILSINGGAGYLNQSHSVEMAFYRKSSQRLEFFDIDLNQKKPHMSVKDPPLCMSCHGDLAGTVHGPRPIFDPFGSWPRFVGGAQRCFAEQDKLQLHQQRMAVEAVLKNDRFACLNRNKLPEMLKTFDQRPGEVLNAFNGLASLSGLDSFLFNVNSERVARIIRDTPDYDAYKFAIVGAEICSTDFSNNLSKWIPNKELSKHSQLKSVSLEAARVKSPADLKEMIERAKVEGQRYRARAAANLAKDLRDSESGLSPADKLYICQNPQRLDSEEGVDDLLQDARLYSGNDKLRAYIVDQAFRRKPHEIRGSTNPLMRFLFEGRGIDMGTWGMEPTTNEYRINFSVSEDLIKMEKPGSLLWAINRRQENAARRSSPAPAKSDSDLYSQCLELRKASFQALSRLKASPSLKQQSEVTR